MLAADIRITPVDANSRNPGLRISDSWSLFGTDSIFSVLSFNVQVKPSGATIKDASLIALTTQTLLGNAITQATEGAWNVDSSVKFQSRELSCSARCCRCRHSFLCAEKPPPRST